MSIFVDADYVSLNKYKEELCGDKVEIIRNKDFVVIVLADGLGSGVKANILSTLTSKIIATMLSLGSSIEDAVETIAKTLPVCKERDLAYSTFSILQIYESGESYLVEFDNPSIIRLIKGKYVDFKRSEREIEGKVIKESRFVVAPEDLIVMISDGVIHAGVGQNLSLGWQWDNAKNYIEHIYKKEISARTISKILLSVCNNLYASMPGDDTTVVGIRIKKALQVNLLIGPPVDRAQDPSVVNKFLASPGKKIVCGGTTSQILSRIMEKSIETNFNYIDPKVPPTASIEGIDLTTEGVLTVSKALEYLENYMSLNTIVDIDKEDGASKLAKCLIEESTSVHFYVGRAINPSHQNPDFPLNLGMKLKLVEDLEKCLNSLGKRVVVEYF